MLPLVDRPRRPFGGPTPKHPIDDLLRTLNTRKAIRIALRGRKATTVISALHRLAGRRGLRFHHRRNGSTILAWVERRQEALA